MSENTVANTAHRLVPKAWHYTPFQSSPQPQDINIATTTPTVWKRKVRLTDLPWPHKALISTLPRPYQGQWKEREPFPSAPGTLLCVRSGWRSFFQRILPANGDTKGTHPYSKPHCPNPKLPEPTFLKDEDTYSWTTSSVRTFAGGMVTVVSCQLQTLPRITRLHSLAAGTIYNFPEGPTCSPARLPESNQLGHSTLQKTCERPALWISL